MNIDLSSIVVIIVMGGPLLYTFYRNYINDVMRNKLLRGAALVLSTEFDKDVYFLNTTKIIDIFLKETSHNDLELGMGVLQHEPQKFAQYIIEIHNRTPINWV